MPAPTRAIAAAQKVAGVARSYKSGAFCNNNSVNAASVANEALASSAVRFSARVRQA